MISACFMFQKDFDFKDDKRFFLQRTGCEYDYSKMSERLPTSCTPLHKFKEKFLMLLFRLGGRILPTKTQKKSFKFSIIVHLIKRRHSVIQKKSSHLKEPYLMSPSSCSLGDRMDFVLTLDWRTSVCSEVVWGNLKMMKAKLERAKRIFKEKIEISIVLWRFRFRKYLYVTQSLKRKICI